MEKSLFVFVAFFASFPLSVFCIFNDSDVFIRPKTLNPRGIIGPGKTCPRGTIAVGFKMKMQSYSRTSDNSALTGLRLLCSDNSMIKSSEAREGIWTDEVRCRKDEHIVGVKIKTEPWLGWDEDDIGAVDFEAICSSGIRLHHRSLSGWFTRRGQWSPEVHCPKPDYAVCGLKVRLDEPGRRGGLFEVRPDMQDDSAGVTEAQFKCCKIGKISN